MKKIAALALSAAALLGADTPFKTHTELSYVQTQGNTDTNAFSLDFTAQKSWEAHQLKFDLDALYGSQGDLENKNMMASELNYDYAMMPILGINYLAGFKRDRFSGFEYQAYTGPGLKYTPQLPAEHTLGLQANILYSVDEGMDKYFDAAGDEIKYPYPDGKSGATKIDGESEDYTGYVLKLTYAWQLLENLKFAQEASYRGDMEENERYFVYSKSAVETKISDMLSMGVSYRVDYTNLPPLGNEYTDRTFLTSLIIDY